MDSFATLDFSCVAAFLAGAVCLKLIQVIREPLP